MAETATINVTKSYRPRKLLQDVAHRLARLKYKRRRKNTPEEIRKRLKRKLWARKNRAALKRRADFVRKQRHARGLD